jgi:hypothetical protein
MLGYDPRDERGAQYSNPSAMLKVYPVSPTDRSWPESARKVLLRFRTITLRLALCD